MDNFCQPLLGTIILPAPSCDISLCNSVSCCRYEGENTWFFALPFGKHKRIKLFKHSAFSSMRCNCNIYLIRPLTKNMSSCSISNSFYISPAPLFQGSEDCSLRTENCRCGHFGQISAH